MIDERIEKAIGRCNPDEPLQPEDPRWHNFDQVRHVTLHRNIHRLLRGAAATRQSPIVNHQSLIALLQIPLKPAQNMVQSRNAPVGTADST